MVKVWRATLVDALIQRVASLILFKESAADMKNILFALCVIPSLAFAWGKRGHQVVGETAAQLVGQEKASAFMKSRSFDFGYYANVPDFIWKRPQTYDRERNQHFMDMEQFEREFKGLGTDPFELSREEFEAKFPNIKENAGRAFWRIRELNDLLTELTEKLRSLKEDVSSKERQSLQEKWLVTAGVIAHYVGDLGQPLHVTENYDGQMTEQKGVHAFFEDDIVDELYPQVQSNVHVSALKLWPEFKKKNQDKTVLGLLKTLVKNSSAKIKPLLALDKSGKRDVNLKNAKRYQKLIEERLVDSILVLAEIYRRQLGWKFDGNRFYFFAGEPEFIAPGKPPMTNK